jgi:sialate O-acetylesterase
MVIRSGLFTGMVLQRLKNGAGFKVSGECESAGSVTVTATEAGKPLPGFPRVIGSALNGKFTAECGSLNAGGPYKFTFKIGEETQIVDEVYVGDLWLLAGQSNMQGVGDLQDAPSSHELVRCFTMDRHWEVAREPLHFMATSPDPVHNEGRQLVGEAAKAELDKMVKGVGPGLWFGLIQREKTGVPQGLIPCAHGGTSMAQWDPDLKKEGGKSLYGSMSKTLELLHQPLAGVLWYQGCDDTNPECVPFYTGRMKKLVQALREDQAQADLPWLTVQIGRTINRSFNEKEWHDIQEQQRLLPQAIPNLDVTTAADLDMDDWIHVAAQSHKILAERLSLLADRLVYKLPGTEPAPQPASVRWLPGDPCGLRVELTVAHAVGGLRTWGGRPLGFSMADDKLRPYPVVCRSKIQGNRVILRVTTDELIDYGLVHGLGCDFAVNVMDGRGLPLPVFGPLPIAELPAVSHWFKHWDSAEALPGASIFSLPKPERSLISHLSDKKGDGWQLINLATKWKGLPLHSICFSYFNAPEEMDVEVRVGNDCHLRVWVDDVEVLRDENPVGLIEDYHKKQIHIGKGRHEVTVLAANQGTAKFGFYMRLARLDKGTTMRGRNDPCLPEPRA